MNNMRKIILIVLTTVLIYACNKSQAIKECSKVPDTLPKNESIRNNKDTIALTIPYNQTKDIPVDNLIKKYPPLRDETFILGKDNGFISEFRMGLANIFKEEEIRKRDIKIREVTWETSKTKNLTIWYEKKDNKWVPIDHFIWDKDSEF